jgi:hypothetical protein
MQVQVIHKMSDTESTLPPPPVPPASPEMAALLAVNRTGRLAPGQHRMALIAGVVALVLLLCPLIMLIQTVALVITRNLPVVTPVGLIFTGLGGLFLLVFVALIGFNVQMFLPDALGKCPVRYERGPLQIYPSAEDRPELPFSYLIGSYSFAPYVAPPDMTLQPGAPYLVYYAAHSRMLLSMAALDAPDADQWEPAFDPKDGTTP